jgi:flavin reductase (DIM6/NTAB) family NADH-FMN oxidoreductase RutF
MDTDRQQAIGKVLGRIPSGVWILTASDGDGRETGMLASWVQQAAFEPPLLTFAVNRERFLNDWLARTQTAALSLLGESQKQFLRHFGSGFKPEEPAFEGIQTVRGETGLPLLSEALAALEGRITGSLTAGDHMIYLLEITAATAGPSLTDERPLVHLRKNGFRY